MRIGPRARKRCVHRGGSNLLVGGVAGMGMLVSQACLAGELERLKGQWRGEGLDLLIDTDRLQASLEPGRPFSRLPLHIRDITGSMFFFSVGRDTFLALAEADTLKLTRVGSSRALLLSRVR